MPYLKYNFTDFAFVTRLQCGMATAMGFETYVISETPATERKTADYAIRVRSYNAAKTQSCSAAV